MAIASLLLFIALAFLRKSQPITKAIILPSTLIGLTLHGAYLGGCFFAVSRGLPAGVTALIVSLQPVLTAVWMSQWAGQGAAPQQVSRRQWLGLALGLGGLLLVVWRKLGAGSEVSGLTLGAAVFALLSITAGTLYQKHFM